MRSRRRAWSLWGCLLVSLATPCAAYQDEDSVRSNLALEQQLVRAIAGELLGRAGVAAGLPVILRVDPAGEGWITQQAAASALQAAAHEVTLTDSAFHAEGALIEIHNPALAVRYTDPVDDGLFGTRRVKRTVSAELACIVTSFPGGAVRLSETLSRSISDTIRVDAIPGIESAGLKSTRGELPEGRFIDRIVEPFVIVGATGVVVYLLFNIRS